MQGVWPRLATTSPIKGPDFRSGCVATSPVLPGRGSGPWQVTATGKGGDVRVMTMDPASHVLSALDVRVTLGVFDSGGRSCVFPCTNTWKSGDPWPLPERTTTTSRYMGSGDEYGNSRSWSGYGLVMSIALPVGILVGVGILFYCGYLCVSSGTKEIANTNEDGSRRNQSSRLGIPLSNRAPAGEETGQRP